MKIGEWVAVNDEGLWVDIFDDGGRVSFQTKRKAIESISSALLDAAAKPNVKRVSSGVYIYRPKDCDTGYYDGEYILHKVTKENIKWLKELEDFMEE